VCRRVFTAAIATVQFARRVVGEKSSTVLQAAAAAGRRDLSTYGWKVFLSVGKGPTTKKKK
jgi:hypothetical protein